MLGAVLRGEGRWKLQGCSSSYRDSSFAHGQCKSDCAVRVPYNDLVWKMDRKWGTKHHSLPRDPKGVSFVLVHQINVKFLSLR